MKRIIKLFFQIIFFSIVLVYLGTVTFGVPSFSYVYSESMEPTIMRYSGFIVIPPNNLEVGDIITYKPVFMDADLVTHRIVGIDDLGFITKGDNSFKNDQSIGEPSVEKDRIYGKAMSIFGKPIVLPGFGYFMSSFDDYNFELKIFSGFLIVLAILFSITENKKKGIPQTPKKKIRVKTLYRIVAITGSLIMFLSMFLSTKEESVKYLVTDNPKDNEMHVGVNKASEIEYTVNNFGILPSWIIYETNRSEEIIENTNVIGPMSSSKILFETKPHNKIGWKESSFEIYNYPMLIPFGMVENLHDVNPNLAFLGISMMSFLYSEIFFILLNYFFKIEENIPIKHLFNSKFRRRFKKIKLKIYGR